ncbi:hypothetical protein SAMN07250955_1167 [Arboricoccus pini]|uniref:Uncharacterized protein n=1 Tax=Arboricoccus pini TaxID=1963835 RepID=A0A212RW74_9PROT|nr:hypothetical protein [Arboricoccus pini]SNB76984.1 hypothetical protein SAMN07250955_1167 [Arboricoccus pini]
MSGLNQAISTRSRLTAVMLMAALSLGGVPALAEEAGAPPATTAAPDEPPPPDPASVTTHLFARNLMSSVQKPAHFVYDVARLSKGEAPVKGHILMDVREIGQDGVKSVYFKTDGGFGPFDFGPVQASSQNPVVIVYLQDDVVRLQRLTGGSQQYFRNRIRAAFNGPARIEPVEVSYKDRKFTGERMTILPFAGDEHLKEHPEIKEKSYSFTVVPDLPGGIYSIAAQVPNPSGGAPVEDGSITLTDMTPVE